jgi:phosphohistidine phosphatase
MKLYLVQHARAVDKKADPERPLSAEGVQEAQSIAGFFANRPLNVKEIWHSGKTRARQTAEHLCKAVGPNAKLHTHDGLDPNDDVKPVARELRRFDGDLMIVGHLPWLSKLAALLVSGEEDAEPIAFTYAGIVCIERGADDAWRVKWIVVPELVTG